MASWEVSTGGSARVGGVDCREGRSARIYDVKKENDISRTGQAIAMP